MKKNPSVFRPMQVLLHLCFFVFLILQQGYSQTFPPNFQRVTVATGLNTPVAFEFTPDGRILICQKGGQLRVIKNGSLLGTPAITLSVNTAGERGLIGVTVDPNFATNKFVYLYYSTSGTTKNRVSRWVMNGDVLSGPEQVLLDFPNDTHMYHNGGGITFGKDGKLYILAGDDKNSAHAQNLESLFAKVLRINPDGSIPAGNPFTGSTTRSKIWAYGVRNPFTMAVDPVSGKLFVNDVGEETWEEINDATVGGRNFGWPGSEGSGPNLVYRYATNRNDPPPNGQGCAINGGTFFNGAISNYPSTYNGKYFFLDYCGGWIDFINPASPTRNSFATGLPSGMVYLKQGPDGNLYFLNVNNGNFYRIIYTLNQSPVITAHPQSISVSQGNTANFSVTASGAPTLTYQWRKNGVNIPGATSSTYSISNVQPSHAGQYSVVVSNSFPPPDTSNNATLTVTIPNTPPQATINTPADSTIYRAGDVINYSGTGTDAEQGTLPGSAFEWFLDFRHAGHGHGGPELTDGVSSGSFVIDTRGHSETDVFYRLYLVVRDAQGAVDTAMVRLFPRLSNLSFQTEPAGLQIMLDGVPRNTPLTTQAISGSTRPIAPLSPQTVNGVTYVFDRWAHGGPASQTINITDNPASYTAIYKVSTSTPVLFTATHDAYVRSGAHAGTTHGTTDPANLIVKRAPAAQVDNTRETYLKFDLTSVSGNVSSVQLRVFGRIEDATATNIPVGVFSVANTTWTESAITNSNKPPTSGTAIQTTTVTDATARYYTWDITSYVQSELAAGRKIISLALKSGIEHNPRTMWNSKETGTNPPQLSVLTDGGGGNADPAITITAPADSATFTAPASITLNATATDSDGTITKVEFFGNNTRLVEDFTAPYSFTWNNVQPGEYVITAVATDNLGAQTSTAITIFVNPPPAGLPAPWVNTDIGAVAAAGSASHSNGTFTINGSGADIWGTADEFHYVYQPVNGNVEIIARVNSITNTNAWAKAGVMIRETLAANSTHAMVVVTPANGVSFQRRTATGGTSTSTAGAGAAPIWLKLTRSGSTFTAATSANGTTWTTVGTVSITMGANVQVGMAVTSHADGTIATAPFSNVTVTGSQPACPPVIASADDGNVAANVLDNNFATRWSASGDGQWIQFCLSAVSNVSGVQIAFYNGNQRQSIFDVLTSSDGTTWTNAATGLRSSGTSLALENFSFPARSVKYVRILGHGNTVNLWNSYTEVRINTGATLTTAPTRERIEESVSLNRFNSFPNPFKENSTITFHLKQAGKTVVTVYDVLGKEIAVLVNGYLSAGNHRVTFRPGNLPAGVYTLKLIHDGKVITRKLMKE